MSNIDLKKFETVCHSIGGVKTITVTPKDNISIDTGLPVIIDPLKAYSIIFKKNSGNYQEQSRKSAAGNIIEQTLRFFITQKRFDIDYIIGQLLDNKCHALYEDWNGQKEVLLNASFGFKYGTGNKRSDRNGYDFNFKAKTRKKYLNLEGIGVELPVGDDPDTGTSTPTTGGGITGGNNQSALLVIINPNPINFIPQTNGNTQFLNQFIIDPNGHKHFIDYQGSAMRFDVLPPNHLQFKSDHPFVGNTITIPNIPQDDYYINLNGNRRTLSNTVDKNTFTRNGDVFTFYRLTDNSTIDIYF